MVIHSLVLRKTVVLYHRTSAPQGSVEASNERKERKRFICVMIGRIFLGDTESGVI